jgi:hypothetical protein
MKRRSVLAALSVCLALLASLVAATSASSWGQSAVPYGEGKIAYDCSGGASLAPGSKTTVDWVIWCGPVTGRMKFKIYAPKRGGAVKWGAPPRIDGTTGPLHCAQEEDKLACELRKTGPLTIRGRLEEEAGACTAPTLVSIRDSGLREGESFFKRPWGCPGSEPPQPPKLSAILKFRAAEVLDPALGGDRGALVAKARGLRRAWIAESPVERWSRVAWGSPLDANDAKLLARRQHAIAQAGHLIEPWVLAHELDDTFAGWAWGPGSSIWIGFTEDQAPLVARMRKQLPFIEPKWIKPFAVQPRYSKEELEEVWMSKVVKIARSSGRRKYFISAIDVDVLANKVEILAPHTTSVRRLLAERLGPDAPIEVKQGMVEFV